MKLCNFFIGIKSVGNNNSTMQNTANRDVVTILEDSISYMEYNNGKITLVPTVTTMKSLCLIKPLDINYVSSDKYWSED